MFSTNAAQLSQPQQRQGSVEPEASAQLAVYLQELEALFVAVRGRGVHWSPSDSGLATTWFCSGVELATIARVLDESAAAWRYTHGEAALPQSLRWIEAAVARAVGEAGALGKMAAAVGAGERSVSYDTVSHDTVAYNEAAYAEALARDAHSVLSALHKDGTALAARHDDPAVQRATRRAAQTIGRWLSRPPSGDPLDRLATLRDRLVAAVLAGIGATAAASVKAEAEARLPAGLLGSARAEALRHELAWAVDASYHVALPYWQGWRRPSVGGTEGQP